MEQTSYLADGLVFGDAFFTCEAETVNAEQRGGSTRTDETLALDRHIDLVFARLLPSMDGA
jgi:hypothetical protein